MFRFIIINIFLVCKEKYTGKIIYIILRILGARDRAVG